MRHLLKGRFYWHLDGSTKGAHPSYLYYKDDNKNIYKICCFTMSNGRNRYKLNKSIDPSSKSFCYLLKTPRIVKRRSFRKELVGFKIDNKIDKARIKIVSRKK